MKPHLSSVTLGRLRLLGAATGMVPADLMLVWCKKDSDLKSNTYVMRVVFCAVTIAKRLETLVNIMNAVFFFGLVFFT